MTLHRGACMCTARGWPILAGTALRAHRRPCSAPLRPAAQGRSDQGPLRWAAFRGASQLKHMGNGMLFRSCICFTYRAPTVQTHLHACTDMAHRPACSMRDDVCTKRLETLTFDWQRSQWKSQHPPTRIASINLAAVSMTLAQAWWSTDPSIPLLPVPRLHPPPYTLVVSSPSAAAAAELAAPPALSRTCAAVSECKGAAAGCDSVAACELPPRTAWSSPSSATLAASSSGAGHRGTVASSTPPAPQAPGPPWPAVSPSCPAGAQELRTSCPCCAMLAAAALERSRSNTWTSCPPVGDKASRVRPAWWKWPGPARTRSRHTAAKVPWGAGMEG